MTTQAIITCVILVITMVLLISQKVPLVILGAAIPAALAATGVINAGSAYTEFGNTTIVFFMGLVVVGEAFFKTGARPSSRPVWPTLSAARSSVCWARPKRACCWAPVLWPAACPHS